MAARLLILPVGVGLALLAPYGLRTAGVIAVIAAEVALGINLAVRL